jgi:hypothetical protein
VGGTYSAGVDRVVPHPLEDDTGLADGVDDGGKSRLGEDDVGGTTGGVGGTLDGDSDVGTGEGGGVVGSVSSHGDEVTESLETLDDLVLVLGEHTSKAVGVHDHLVERLVLAVGREASGLEDGGGVHLRADGCQLGTQIEREEDVRGLRDRDDVRSP